MHAARGSPGHRERSNAAGAERSASRAAHRASRRADPAAGERAGGRRKTRTGATERGNGRAGRGREGGAAPPRATRAGHPQLRGSLPAMLEAPPRRGWGGGRGSFPPPRAVSRDQARSLKPGVDWFSDLGSPGPASLRTGGPGGVQGCGDLGLVPACREWPGAGVSGRFGCNLLLQPVPLAPAQLSASWPRLEADSAPRYATSPRLEQGDCGRAPGPPPARRGALESPILGYMHSQASSLVDPSVTSGFPNPTAPFV